MTSASRTMFNQATVARVDRPGGVRRVSATTKAVHITSYRKSPLPPNERLFQWCSQSCSRELLDLVRWSWSVGIGDASEDAFDDNNLDVVAVSQLRKA